MSRQPSASIPDSARRAPAATRAAARRGPTFSDRALRLLRESRALLVTALGLYLTMVLGSYDRADPGWSHAAPAERLHNMGGLVGAWLADLLLYLFGLSAWMLVVLAGVAVWREFAGLRAASRAARGLPVDDGASDRFAWERWLGFGLFMLACVGLEAALRPQAGLERLPLGPGGVVGGLVNGPLVAALGTMGAAMALAVTLVTGLSLFLGVSWLGMCERIGGVVEEGWARAMQAISARRDRRLGEEAAVEREGQVQDRRRRRPEAEPAPRSEPVMAPDAFLDETSVATGDATGRARGPAPVPLAARREPAPAPSVPAAPAAAEEGAPPAVAASVPEPRPPKETVVRQAVSFVFADPPDGTSLPAVSLLDPPPPVQEMIAPDALEYTSRLIEKKLADFGVQVKVVEAYPGPVITRYEIEPATGVKGSQIVNLSKDLARALSLVSIRVVETIPGKNLMGLELPNPRRQVVRLSEILASPVFSGASSAVTLALGKDISGGPVCADLAKMPHLLVAGTTGSGKSVGINAMLLSLLYKADPSEVRLILIDPKMLEMSVYDGIPHLLAPVVTDMKHAGNALNWCVAEMERRYKLMSKLGVRNLAGYNAKIADAEKRETPIPNPFSLTPDLPEPLGRLPTIVVVIDELADLMMVVGKKVEELIARLAQKARAAGIHLVLATQRPSVDVITGLIKANIPTRMAFQVSSKIDSRTILDQMGAESLLGMGDMLYMPPGSGLPQRVHGAFVSDEEVHRVVEHWKSKGEPDYIEGITEAQVPEDADTGSAVGFGGLASTLSEGGEGGESDPLYDQAVAVVVKHKRASISLVQRHLRIGYNRAARLLEQMEKSGLVSAMATNGNRDILVPARDEAA